MTNRKHHGESGAERLDRLVPLVGLGLAAFFVGRAAARRGGPAQLTSRALPRGVETQLVPAHVAAVVRPRTKIGWTKKFLVLAMMIGIISLVLGGSTFGSFNAETMNPGSTFSTGTLTLNNTAPTGSVCASTAATSNDNLNPSCTSILTLANEIPGAIDSSGTWAGGDGKVIVTNTGSLNASTFSLYAPYSNAKLNTQVANGATIGPSTNITISPLEGTVATNDKIWLSYNGTVQQFCAGAAAVGGAGTINLSGGYAVGSSGACPASSTTAGIQFPVGTRVWDASSNTSASNTDCYDSQVTNITINVTTGNPLCSTALLWVQEQSNYGGSTYSYCWFGRGSTLSNEGGNTEDANGLCRTPTTLVLGTNITAGSASYSLNAGTITGNITSGDTITFVQGGNTMTCTAGATYVIGYSSTISVNTCSGGGSQTFTGAATITDTTALGVLNGTNSSSTISYFDQHHAFGSSSQLFLPPLTGNGATNATATVQLGKTGTAGSSGVAPATRTFYIGVYLPNTGSTVSQNTLQGLMSTFGLTWRADQ